MALRDRKDSIFLGWMKMESTLIHDYNLKKTSDFLRLMKMECFFLGWWPDYDQWFPFCQSCWCGSCFFESRFFATFDVRTYVQCQIPWAAELTGWWQVWCGEGFFEVSGWCSLFSLGVCAFSMWDFWWDFWRSRKLTWLSRIGRIVGSRRGSVVKVGGLDGQSRRNPSVPTGSTSNGCSNNSCFHCRSGIESSNCFRKNMC